MSDDTSDDSEVPVIPLRIIDGQGQARPAPMIREERRLSPEQLRAVIQLNDRSRQLLYRIGEIESQILKIASEKIKTYNEYKQVQDALISQAKEAAREVGIDPDDDSRAWTLNIESGAFVRTR